MTFIILAFLAMLLSATNSNAIQREESRIIGGKNVIQGELPFVVSVHNDTDFLCTGTLIDVYWVLTSASCIWNFQKDELKVSLGGVKYNGTEIGRYDIIVDNIIPHEDYLTSNNFSSTRNSYFFFNNMALLKLKTPAKPSNIVQPIVLTSFTEIIPPGTSVKVAGWGGSNHGTPSPTLQYSQNLITMQTVDCSIDILILLSDLDVCTEKSEQSTCEFDHGGPLYLLDLVRGYILVGIVNYAPCGNGLPNVFASATGQRWWINKVAQL